MWFCNYNIYLQFNLFWIKTFLVLNIQGYHTDFAILNLELIVFNLANHMMVQCCNSHVHFMLGANMALQAWSRFVLLATVRARVLEMKMWLNVSFQHRLVLILFPTMLALPHCSSASTSKGYKGPQHKIFQICNNREGIII